MNFGLKIRVVCAILLFNYGYIYAHKGHHHKDVRDDHFLHDADHIMEDIGDIDKNKVQNMTADELEFQFFRLHDHDHNLMLDGLEVLMAINHHISDNPTLNPEQEILTSFVMEQASLAVDLLLAQADFNGDGFLEYSEYKKAVSNHREQPSA